jgi:hypothetical protein
MKIIIIIISNRGSKLLLSRQSYVPLYGDNILPYLKRVEHCCLNYAFLIHYLRMMATAERSTQLNSLLKLLSIQRKPSPQSCTGNALSWVAFVRMYSTQTLSRSFHFLVCSDSTWKKHCGDGQRRSLSFM